LTLKIMFVLWRRQNLSRKISLLITNMQARKKQKKINYVWRINLIKIGFFIFGFILIYRLYNLQVLSGDHYKETIFKQVNYKEKASAKRGSIYFQDKRGKLVSAAVQKTGYAAAVNPNLVQNPENLFEEISEIIEIDRDAFLGKAGKKGDPFEIFAKGLSKEAAGKIKDLKLKEIAVLEDDERFYPAGNLASHILGFVGYKDEDLGGRYGMEYFYNDILKGKESADGGALAETVFNFTKTIFDSAAGAGEGADLILTIEPTAQSFLESVLENTLDRWRASAVAPAPAADTENFTSLTQQVGGIIINPQNGKILAMAAKPDFNPNEYGKVKNFSLFVNPFVENIFEMGSVFKPLTLAAAIDQNMLSASSTYFDKGYVILDGKRIENFDGKGRGKVTMQDVLNESLNTGAVFAMQSLGKNGFKNYIEKYGLGAGTGIDLPNEEKGNISNLRSGREIEYATASFGQGIAITPIEFTAAVSSLANGGYLVKPYIAEKVSYRLFSDRVLNVGTKERILKGSSSETITRMLVNTVDNALLEGTRKMENYSIAAKTGTAQMPKEGGGYYENEYFHSFFGYAPAFDPQFLVFLYFKNPRGVKYASHSLTDPFMDIMKFLLNYYEVPPDR